MIDAARLLDTFLKILRIDSYHPNEDPVVDALRPKLLRAGISLWRDPHRNVLGFWPGTGAKADHEPVLLCAHTDTVRPTPGMEPVIRDGAVHTDGTSVLGADDKAAVAAMVEAIEAITDEGSSHPPVELLLTVGEDVGHIGSKAFDVAAVRSRMAFIPDVDGPVGAVILASPWSETLVVTFRGRAAHAGTGPESGRSALQMAARAIDRMQLGRVDAHTTANAGVLTGGEESNIIPASAELKLQVRSLDEDAFQAHQIASAGVLPAGSRGIRRRHRCGIGQLDDRLSLHAGRRGGAASPGCNPRSRAYAAARDVRRNQRCQRIQRQRLDHGGNLGWLP